MSYLPLTDSGLLNWSRNFQAELSLLADPTTIGLTAANVTDYAAAQADYETKYSAANAPKSRGGAAVLAKNESKDALVALSRSFAMTITNFQGVTDEQRYDFGLTVRDSDPSPVPVPSLSPEIDLKPPVVRSVEVRLHNEASLERRGKPTGVRGALVFSYVGATPPAAADTHLWKFELNTTRTTLELEFPSTVAPGATVWVTACWYNPRGESGPATPPVYTILPGSLAAAA